ncbi:hypothetical protein JB92DRAFT_2919336 [Gautieria morchelliformis]|nr:hypothetical protein JB92DRAFT_2919336 [Gautieria morchelliformis]
MQAMQPTLCPYLLFSSVPMTLSYHDSCTIWKWYYFLVIVLSSMASCNVLLALRLDSLFRNTRYFRLLLIVLCTC